MGMRTRLSMILAVLGLAHAGSAAADTYELSIGSETRFLGSKSTLALSDDQSMPMFAMGGSRRLPLLALPGLDTLADVGFAVGGIEGTTFQTMWTETTSYVFTAGLKVRTNGSERWSAFGRAGLGASRVDVSLGNSYAATEPLADAAWTGCAYVGGGGDLYFASTRRADTGALQFAAGLRMELGYLAASSMRVEPKPASRSEDDDILRIPDMSSSLGDLNLSGWTLRLALTGRF